MLFFGASIALAPGLEFFLFGFFDDTYRQVTLPIVHGILGTIALIFAFARPISIDRLSTIVFCVVIVNLLVTALVWTEISFSLQLVHIPLFSILLLIKSKPSQQSFLLAFIIAFFIVSLLLQMNKIFSSGKTIFEVRAGLNIYGSGYFVGLAMLVASIIQKNEKTVTGAVLILSTLCVFHSALFISRSGLVLSLLFWVYCLINHQSRSATSKAFGIIFLLAPIGLTLFLVNEFLLIRFEVENFVSIAQYLQDIVELQLQQGQRLAEWVISLRIIQDSPLFGTGIGYYIAVGDYSNAHNFTLNTLAESGLLLGSAYLLVFNLLPIIRHWRNMAFCTIFFIYIIFINISGIALIQTHQMVTFIHFLLLLLLLGHSKDENIIR
jgi:O-antigen ligase